MTLWKPKGLTPRTPLKAQPVSPLVTRLRIRCCRRSGFGHRSGAGSTPGCGAGAAGGVGHGFQVALRRECGASQESGWEKTSFQREWRAWDTPKHNRSDQRRCVTGSAIFIPNTQIHTRRGGRLKQQDVTGGPDLRGVEKVGIPLFLLHLYVQIFHYERTQRETQ